MTFVQKRRAAIVAALAAVLLVAATLFGVTYVPVSAHADAATTVTYDFTTAAQLADFTPVYAVEETDGAGSQEAFAAHWTQDTTAGKVTSVRDATGSGGAEGWNRVAQLVLTKYQFTNLEAEVELDYASGATWGWVGLQFRKSNLLSAGRKGGCFAFTQQEGHATLWGDSAFAWDDNGNEETKHEVKNPDEDNFKSTYKYSPFLLTVRVVGKSCDVTVSSTDKATTYATVHTDFSKDDAVRSGFVSLTSADEYNDFYSLKITNLNAQGEPIALEESDVPQSIAFDKTTTQFTVGEQVSLACTVQPAAAAANVIWHTNDGDVAVVRNGSVTGIAAGTATVTATSAFDATVQDSITLTFTEPAQSSNRFVFTDAAVMENFTASYIVDQNHDGNTEDYTAHWKVEDGVLKRINFPANNNDSSENFACLYVNDCETVHYEATLVYRTTNNEYGWIGITSGTLLYNKRCMDEGLGMFVQKEGQPTVWGKNTGAPTEKPSTVYTPADWHILRVRAYGDRVEIYLDDMTAPALTKQVKLENGHVGILTTCKAAFEIKSFTLAYLDENGVKEDYSGIEKLEIANKITSATVGDAHTLQIRITPEADVDYIFTTSDSNIAFVSGGVLRFIADGEVTVTVLCKHEKRLSDSMTVTVAPKATTGTPVTPPAEQNPNGGNTADDTPATPQKSGCKSSAAAACPLMAVAMLGLAAWAVGNKKKSRG